MVYCAFKFLEEQVVSRGEVLKIDLNKYCFKTGTVSSHNFSEEVRAYEINQTAVIVRMDSEKRVLNGMLIGTTENVQGLVRLLNISDLCFPE